MCRTQDISPCTVSRLLFLSHAPSRLNKRRLNGDIFLMCWRIKNEEATWSVRTNEGPIVYSLRQDAGRRNNWEYRNIGRSGFVSLSLNINKLLRKIIIKYLLDLNTMHFKRITKDRSGAIAVAHVNCHAVISGANSFFALPMPLLATLFGKVLRPFPSSSCFLVMAFHSLKMHM